jgi:hypothetical protein
MAFFLYLGFVAAVCWICFRHPVADDFDRYIYEALVRGRYQDVATIYPIVKHENPRAEASSVMDSAEHLAQLEPLYAIRPLYLEAVAAVARTGMSIPRSINLVSALSLFGIGVVLVVWTQRPAYCALLMATPAVALLGRFGTPDALSSLFVLSSIWALIKERLFVGLLLLLTSIWVRTDNVLFVLAILAWLMLTRKLSFWHGAVFACVAVGSVLFIHHFSGNYGWGVLFNYSFVRGMHPAVITAKVNFRDYSGALGRGLQAVGGQEVALWALIGIATWRWLPRSSAPRQLLMAISFAALVRFLLFPTPEDRYFAWAYLIVGAFFIQAINPHPAQRR